ncbi:MAG: siroheme synthase [Alphaproteobacteria bacterium]|nr:siroheme synthase [Alphaproteobacteria bacterium]
MFPIILTHNNARIMLIGKGALAERRAAQLTDARMSLTRFQTTLPSAADLKTAHAVYIVDTPLETAQKIAADCRALGVLVNVEDVTELCDFHTPSLIRRGDLLFTVSTNGKSPALAKRLRRFLENKFNPGWAEKLDKLAEMRQIWRNSGATMDDVTKKTNALIDEENWLPK